MSPKVSKAFVARTMAIAKLIAEVAHRDRQRRVEIRVILDPANNPAGRPLRSASRVFEGAGGGDSRLRKEIYINGVKKRVSELAGLVNVVLFLPQDLAIVEGAPADRRRHLHPEKMLAARLLLQIVGEGRADNRAQKFSAAHHL